MGKMTGREMWLTGVAFEDGEGVVQSNARALAYYVAAGKSGFANGFVSAGNLYRSVNELDRAAGCYAAAAKISAWLAPVMYWRVARLTESGATGVDRFITV